MEQALTNVGMLKAQGRIIVALMLPLLVSVPALKLTPKPPPPPTLALLPVPPWMTPLFVRLFPAMLLSTPVAPATLGDTTPIFVMVSGLG